MSDKATADSKTSGIGVGIGRIPSGCAILTARHGEDSTGILVSWVQQAAFDPPSISIGLKKNRPIEKLIDGSGRFVVNVIGEDPSPMFKHFGKGFELGEPAFDGVEHRLCDAGIIVEACIAHLECKVSGKHSAGDHWLYVGEVVDADGDAEARPYVHLRKNGLNY